MSALPLHQLVPASLLAGKWIVVLVCYLDDSGKDLQNPITTLAGYVARDTGWEAYESAVEPWFTEYGVNVLHAKQLHDTDGEFKDWKRLKKHAFVSRICLPRSPHLMMGLSFSVAKEQYQVRKLERGNLPTISPYGFCFTGLLNWIMNDIRIGGAANTEGVAFILESGHENNIEVEQKFYDIRKRHPEIANLLKSISFVSKESCRAIQLADLFAFYSRREGAAQLNARIVGAETYESDLMIKIITENLPHRGIVANDFGPTAGSLFLAGDP